MNLEDVSIDALTSMHAIKEEEVSAIKAQIRAVEVAAKENGIPMDKSWYFGAVKALSKAKIDLACSREELKKRRKAEKLERSREHSERTLSVHFMREAKSFLEKDVFDALMDKAKMHVSNPT